MSLRNSGSAFDSRRGYKSPSVRICRYYFHLPLRINLKQKTTIKKSIATLLILAFAISAAPKAFFHDLVANHKDFPDCNQVHKTAVLHHQRYNCHFDDLVVSAPFLLVAEQPIAFDNFYFEKKQSSFYFSFTQSFLQHKENRGPPSA